ncbi:hypothetical protein SAMN02799625_04537 [Methylobacterium sp. UNC300MFChir4.1]|uniref:hypothetical protein n=1 Tax=Methylobacterium sp. UNC300MFChir4.1 TaxID=1502747 RepID=UPI0008CA3DB0|nr:hypothetical protein [Methylobacterium sp. UNC300MFChir4.1]SEP04677.1 hypothetical protein SAMN02799625_04537 [Methylobacterium sp. UNC300MFChir4.1]
MRDPDLLRRAGEALYGDGDWRRPMARLLGPHHPDGPRDEVDPRSVSRWSNGGREIPDWVWPVLARLLRERAADAAEVARDIEGGT